MRSTIEVFQLSFCGFFSARSLSTASTSTGASHFALAGEAGMVPEVFTCGVAGPGLGGGLGLAARECPKIASLIRVKMLMGTPVLAEVDLDVKCFAMCRTSPLRAG